MLCRVWYGGYLPQEEEEKRKAKQRHLKYKKDLEAQIRSNAQTPVDPYFHMSNTERMVCWHRHQAHSCRRNFSVLCGLMFVLRRAS